MPQALYLPCTFLSDQSPSPSVPVLNFCTFYGHVYCFSTPKFAGVLTVNSKSEKHMPVAAPSVDPRAFGLIKATYTVRETLDLLSIGRTSLYAAIKRGDLRMVKFGDKSLFRANDLAEFLNKLNEPAA